MLKLKRLFNHGWRALIFNVIKGIIGNNFCIIGCHKLCINYQVDYEAPYCEKMPIAFLNNKHGYEIMVAVAEAHFILKVFILEKSQNVCKRPTQNQKWQSPLTNMILSLLLKEW